MDEYIKRDPLLKSNRWLALSANDIATAKSIILGQPAADVVEVRHGEWVKAINQKHSAKWSSKVACSVCRCQGCERYNYCPNCGAKMDGKGEGE